MKRVRLAAVVTMFLASIPAARAQEGEEAPTAESLGELPRPDFWEGGGVRVTEGTVFHPSFELSSGYQSNVFYQDPDDGPSGPMGAGLARFTVGASFGTISAERAEAEAPGSGSAGPRLLFDLGAMLTWVQYLASQDVITEQSDLGIGLNASVKLNPTGKVSLELRDSFVRNVNPGQSLREDLDRDRNELNARLIGRPGGGAIEAYLAYSFIIDVFESSVLLFQDRITHSGGLGASWRWLPKTVFSVDATMGTVSPSNTALKSESTPLRVTGGVSTLLTPVLGLIVRGGYGNGFYARGENVSTYLALVEARVAIGPTLRLAGGYSHDFADGLVGNFFVDHLLFARAGWQAMPRLQLRASGELRLRSYGGIVDTGELDFCGDATCANFRDDLLTRLEVTAELQLRAWLFAGLVYSLQMDRTDFFVRSETIDSGAYVANEVFARVSARF